MGKLHSSLRDRQPQISVEIVLNETSTHIFVFRQLCDLETGFISIYL